MQCAAAHSTVVLWHFVMVWKFLCHPSNIYLLCAGKLHFFHISIDLWRSPWADVHLRYRGGTLKLVLVFQRLSVSWDRTVLDTLRWDFTQGGGIFLAHGRNAFNASVKLDALSSLTQCTNNLHPRVSTLSKEMHNQRGGGGKETHAYTWLLQSLFLSYSIKNNQAQRGDADEFAWSDFCVLNVN